MQQQDTDRDINSLLSDNKFTFIDNESIAQNELLMMSSQDPDKLSLIN